MTSGGSKKKKRKATKKKKKKQGINIHSPPTTLQEEHNDLGNHYSPICNGIEDIGCSSVGVVLEPKLMGGSGNDGTEEVVKDLDHGVQNDETVETIQSLDEGVPEKSVCDDPIEKVISSVSEEMDKLAEEIPVLEETVGTFVEAIPIEKIKESGLLESISKEVEDREISLDSSRVEGSHGRTEEESKEPDEEPEKVPIVPLVLKRSTWKSCCGLFE